MSVSTEENENDESMFEGDEESAFEEVEDTPSS